MARSVGERDERLSARGVGAYKGGNGRIYVRVQHRTLPLVERDVVYLGESLTPVQSSEVGR